MTLTVDERTERGWWMVSVGGDLDLYTVPALRSALSDALAAVRGRARDVEPADLATADGVPLHGVVVDLAAVTFMDSAGLGVLVGAYKRAKTEGMRLQVAGASASVSRLFKITGLLKVFEVAPSVGQALTTTA